MSDNDRGAGNARPLWRRLLKWLAFGIAGIVVLACGALAVAYWTSTNACDTHDAAMPDRPMKAIVYCEYGTADVLHLQDVEKPAPEDDQVLVKVRAASVNPYDWHFMRGTPYFMRLMSGLRKPKSTRLGVDFAGTVEAVGAKVTKFKPGDEVFGGRSGAFAEYVAVREDRAIAMKPAGVSFEQAASIPIAALTALQALRDTGKVQVGQKVLINGASGGVGTFAVQLAKNFGANVTGVCSTRNLDLVRSLGADKVIDYTKEDFAAGADKYDLILDNVANRTLADFRRVLTPDGQYVQIGGGGPDAGRWIGPMGRVVGAKVESKFVSQKMGMMMAELEPDDLVLVAGLVASGKVTPVIDRRYPLSEVPAAIRYLEEGHARGKVIITMD